MALLDEIRAKRDIILKTAEECGLTNVRVFGSVARGEETDESDVDFLVSMLPHAKLLSLVGFEQALAENLHRKVDVLDENTLHWYIKDNILKDASAV